MKLETQLDADSLAVLGAEAVGLLCRGEISLLASRYGYALAYGRDIPTAIRDDLRGCLDQVGSTALAAPPEYPVDRVLFYQPNRSNLVAVVECLVPTADGASLLVELVVTSKGEERYITLEQISAPS